LNMYSNIVFFDGYCVLCNAFVDFLLETDRKKSLKFASLQGITAKRLLPPSYLLEVDTVIFINNNNNILTKSLAIIDILKVLGGFWRLTAVFSVLPSFLLDKLYDILARNRYSWFGKRNQCRLPNAEEKERILP
jgi:predicted DCC family thiol-disulfide oxidoreductase YuxK